MERHWYYIGIAFFGMINGMFHPIWRAVRICIQSKILMAVPLFGSEPLRLLFFVADALDRDDHPGRNSGRDL